MVGALLYRTYALIHVVVSVVSGWGSYPHPWAALAIGSAIVVENLGVAAICALRRRLDAWVISVDTAVGAAATRRRQPSGPGPAPAASTRTSCTRTR